jgi:TetR/AcrR family transcriptional regulator
MAALRRPSSVPRATIDRILDAAEIRFAQRGYEATSLADIADDVEIRTPSLYKHFASKRELHLAVLERLLDPYFELLGRLLTVPRDAEEAQANLVAVVTHYMQTPRLARMVQHAALAGDDELDLLVTRWYEPLFRRAAELTPVAPFADLRQSIALVITFHSMISGYVTLAPLHARLTGRDPLGAEALGEQLALMGALTRQLWAPPLSNPPPKSKPSKPKPKPKPKR